MMTEAGTLVVSLTYVGNHHGNEGWKCFGAVAAGLVLAQLLSYLSEYFTSIEHPSGREEALREGPAVIMATSGMLEGGPVLQYFEHVAPSERNKILFVSYQVQGTLGRRVLDGTHQASLLGDSGKIKIVDVKCPDSGEADTFDKRNLEAVDAKDEIKFVLSTRRDYEFAREFTREHGLAVRVKQVLFSPAFADPNGKWPGLEPRTLVEWILADGLPVRLGLQLHKFIWHPATQGV